MLFNAGYLCALALIAADMAALAPTRALPATLPDGQPLPPMHRARGQAQPPEVARRFGARHWQKQRRDSLAESGTFYRGQDPRIRGGVRPANAIPGSQDVANASTTGPTPLGDASPGQRRGDSIGSSNTPARSYIDQDPRVVGGAQPRPDTSSSGEANLSAEDVDDTSNTDAESPDEANGDIKRRTAPCAGSKRRRDVDEPAGDAA